MKRKQCDPQPKSGSRIPQCRAGGTCGSDGGLAHPLRPHSCPHPLGVSSETHRKITRPHFSLVCVVFPQLSHFFVSSPDAEQLSGVCKYQIHSPGEALSESSFCSSGAQGQEGRSWVRLSLLMGRQARPRPALRRGFLGVRATVALQVVSGRCTDRLCTLSTCIRTGSEDRDP